MILTDKVLKVWHTFLSWLHIWTGSKLFPIVVVYCPYEEDVLGLTFTTEEEYAEKIMEIEDE